MSPSNDISKDVTGKEEKKGRFRQRAIQLVILVFMASLAMSFFISPGQRSVTYEGDWEEIDVSPGVGQLSGCTMTYLPWSNDVLLFGGHGGGSYSDSLWVYDLSDDQWDQISFQYGPSARAYHAVAFDDGSKSFFVFGGFDGDYFGDLWRFRGQNDTWEMLSWERLSDQSQGLAPSPRYGHSMVFDSKSNSLYLLGGYNGGFLEDMWKFDLVSLTWEEIGTESGFTARSGHVMVYVKDTNEIYIQGGEGDQGTISEMWRLDLYDMRWDQLEIKDVSGARFNHTMVLDKDGKRVYTYGGLGQRAYGVINLGDLWRFDLNEETWGKVDTAHRPSTRFGHAMAFNEQERFIIIFGGSDADGIKGDMWKIHVGSPNPTDLESKFTSAFAFFAFILVVITLMVVAALFLGKHIESKRRHLKSEGTIAKKKPEFDFRLYQQDDVQDSEEDVGKDGTQKGRVKKLDTLKEWESERQATGEDEDSPLDGDGTVDKDIKQLKTLVCPSCGGKEMYYEAGMIFGNMYHCKDCDYIGAFVVEKDIQVTKDSGKKAPKRKYLRSDKKV